jgi:hypothetical protein
VLGESLVEDYAEGDSEYYFSTDSIDVTGIAPSSLANCGKIFTIVISFYYLNTASTI